MVRPSNENFLTLIVTWD